MRKDPTERYVTVSLFAPGGGYIGVIDTLTKEAIGLFRATQFRYMGEASPQRSNHMSNFSRDGKYIIVSNLDGKAMERIDVTRDRQGIITQLTYNKSATLGLGKNMVVNAPATFFKGQNAFGNDLVGGITGDYTVLGLSNFTPQECARRMDVAQLIKMVQLVGDRIIVLFAQFRATQDLHTLPWLEEVH